MALRLRYRNQKLLLKPLQLRHKPSLLQSELLSQLPPYNHNSPHLKRSYLHLPHLSHLFNNNRLNLLLQPQLLPLPTLTTLNNSNNSHSSSSKLNNRRSSLLPRDILRRTRPSNNRCRITVRNISSTSNNPRLQLKTTLQASTEVNRITTTPLARKVSSSSHSNRRVTMSLLHSKPSNRLFNNSTSRCQRKLSITLLVLMIVALVLSVNLTRVLVNLSTSSLMRPLLLLSA